MLILGVMASVSTYAYEYPYLIIQKNDGNTVDIETASATLEFAGSHLVVADVNGTQSYDLTSLNVMYFSTESSSITATELDGVGDVELYSVSGVSCGKFPDIAAAVKALDAGIYLVKGKSRTIKIAVR